MTTVILLDSKDWFYIQTYIIRYDLYKCIKSLGILSIKKKIRNKPCQNFFKKLFCGTPQKPITEVMMVDYGFEIYKYK